MSDCGISLHLYPRSLKHEAPRFAGEPGVASSQTRSDHHSVQALEAEIRAAILELNGTLKPFISTKTSKQALDLFRGTPSSPPLDGIGVDPDEPVLPRRWVGVLHEHRAMSPGQSLALHRSRFFVHDSIPDGCDNRNRVGRLGAGASAPDFCCRQADWIPTLCLLESDLVGAFVSGVGVSAVAAHVRRRSLRRSSRSGRGASRRREACHRPRVR